MAEEQDDEEVLGFRFIDGELVPVFVITPELENEFYAAGEIGPEGLTIIRSR